MARPVGIAVIVAGVTSDRISPSIQIVAESLASAPDDDDSDELDEALEELPLGASRFGGVPDLPPGTAWPDRDGVPMEFIAQVNLADLAGMPAASRLPSSGTLAFFWNSQWASSDMEREARCCAVIFAEGVLERCTPPSIEWKSEYAKEPQIAPSLHGLASLTFQPALSVPGGVSPFITAPLDEFWQDFQAEHGNELAGLGEDDETGHANYLLGYVDEQDYVDAHANGTEDQLLLQVDSEDAAEFSFGDCNKLFFLLTAKELAARDFSKVRVYSSLG